MEPEYPPQSSAEMTLKFFGVILFIAGLLIFGITLLVLKNDHAEFGGLGEAMIIIYVSFPLLLAGIVLFLVGGIMRSIKRRR